MSKLKIAAGTRIAAEAGASVAEQGGNAVDAAIAAMAVSVCTDTGRLAAGCRAGRYRWLCRDAGTGLW
jgi:gamma-glutamyltranspeptidase/glutathione hydrolase